MFRTRLLIRSKSNIICQKPLAKILENLKISSKIKLTVDVDPINFVWNYLWTWRHLSHMVVNHNFLNYLRGLNWNVRCHFLQRPQRDTLLLLWKYLKKCQNWIKIYLDQANPTLFLFRNLICQRIHFVFHIRAFPFLVHIQKPYRQTISW